MRMCLQICQLTTDPLDLQRHAQLQGHSHFISSLAWAGADGDSVLLSGGDDHSVRLWRKGAWQSDSLAAALASCREASQADESPLPSPHHQV